MNELLFIRSFVEGTGSFLSYCVWPLIPGYAAMIIGGACAEQGRADGRRLAWWKAGLYLSLSFIAGFVLLFSLIGAYGAGPGSLLGDSMTAVKRTGGALTLLSGVYILSLAMPRGAALHGPRRPSTPLLQLAAGSLGAASACAWIPCAGPVLADIFQRASVAVTRTSGTILLGEYALGVGIWFIPLGLLMARACVFLQGPLLAQWVQRLAGALLMGTGLLIFQGRLNFFFRLIPVPAAPALISDALLPRGPYGR